MHSWTNDARRPGAHTNAYPTMLTAQQAHFIAMQQGINPGHPRLVGFAAARAVRDTHDNEMEVLASITTNANVDYPHARHRCGVRRRA